MKKVLLAALLAITVATPALADTVYLFDGSSFRGIITKQDDNSITLKTSAGEMNFQKGRVSRISFDDNEKVYQDDEDAPRVSRKVRKRRAYVEHKDPTLACCLSCMIPGLGQAYNGDWGTGLLCFGSSCLAGSVMSAYAQTIQNGYYTADQLGVYYGAMAAYGGVYLIGMLDAHNKAEEINKQSRDEANLSGVMIAEGIH